MSKRQHPETNVTDALRLPTGSVDLGALDPRATPGFPETLGKADAPKLTEAVGDELSDLQERLYANGRAEVPGAPRVLLLLQGMDTSGKGGVIRHSVGLVDPQGIKLTAFKAPTAIERRHHFLWRIKRALPEPGLIGIFDRSHYEDVLVVRVNSLVPAEVWGARYEEINRFEAGLVAQNTTIIKCFLNVSAAEQKQRLAQRLAEPEKYWKYNPGDVTERAKWDDYQLAYAEALRRCNTDAAPWFVVPADRKWYRDWAVARLLLEHLRALDLSWPAATFDVEQERRRVAAS